MYLDDEVILEQNQFEGLIQGLIDNEYGFCDDFVTPSTVLGLLENMQSLSDSGLMKESGIGNKVDFRQDKTVRGDKINWIDSASTNLFELVYLKKIEKFIEHLNNTCYTSIKSFESHYAVYEKNEFYRRHLDQFQNEKGRKYSVVLYLNQEWKEEDGGTLSLYPVGKDPINIAPVGGKMVFFRSDKMEHEVHASTTRNRRSIAGWLKD